MTSFQAIVLGIVQGLTELLPVSSSAHLAIFPWIFEWDEIPESFDIALHIGTFLAIFLYFVKDWIKLLVGGYNYVVKKEKTNDGRLFWFLFWATIPNALLCLVMDQISEAIFGDSIIPIAIAMIAMGVILYFVDKNSKSDTNLENISFKQAMMIGVSQCLAAGFPGVSRSGITMTTARFLGVDRESSAKFSFLLATPIVFGAIIFSIKDFVFNLQFVLGVLASFIVGMIVIRFLLKYLQKGSYKGFAIYRIVVGVILFALMFIK